MRLFSFSELQIRSSKVNFNSTKVYWSFTVMIKFYVSNWLDYGVLVKVFCRCDSYPYQLTLSKGDCHIPSVEGLKSKN